MKMRLSNLRYLLLITVLLFLTACPQNDNPNEPDENISEKSEGSFDVTFTKQTVYFDSTEINDIVSMDTVAHVYKFNKTSIKANEIQLNNILLIHGVALRKVTKINHSGNEIIVETDDATLNEAIQDGTIQWTTYCDFRKENQVQIQHEGKQYLPTLQSGDTLNFEFESNGYTYNISMIMNKSSAYVKLEVSKEIAGKIKGKFAAEGTISAFSSSNTIAYNNSTLTNFSNSNKNLKGDLTLSLTVAGSGNDALDIELPFILIQYPYMVGPIPTFLRLKVQIVINAVVPLEGSAQSSMNFKYDSETGINYNGTKVDINGKIGNYTIKNNKSEIGASSAIAVNYGIGFPRIELGLFNTVFVPWVQTAFLINSDYTFFPTCRQTKASFIGGCGYNFELLGLKQSGKKNLWQKDTVIQKTGDCK